MKLIFLSIILCFVFVCGEQIFNIDEKCYLFSVPLKKTWFGAFQYCRYRGLSLVDIPTYTENERIKGLIENLEPAYKESNFWTSGTDLDSEGNYIWMSTGHPFHYTNWHKSNPDNYFHQTYNERENCVEIRYTDSKHMWNDHACHHLNYFICRNTTVSLFVAK